MLLCATASAGRRSGEASCQWIPLAFDRPWGQRQGGRLSSRVCHLAALLLVAQRSNALGPLTLLYSDATGLKRPVLAGGHTSHFWPVPACLHCGVLSPERIVKKQSNNSVRHIMSFCAAESGAVAVRTGVERWRCGNSCGAADASARSAGNGPPRVALLLLWWLRGEGRE